MAFTRIHNDQCEYDKRRCGNNSILAYTLDPHRHYNNNPCFMDRIPGGNTVSLYDGNLVDLESSLTGRVRHNPTCRKNPKKPKGKLLHLPVGHMVSYRPRPTSKGFKECHRSKKGSKCKKTFVCGCNM
jgi:hypothetical protein